MTLNTLPHPESHYHMMSHWLKSCEWPMPMLELRTGADGRMERTMGCMFQVLSWKNHLYELVIYSYLIIKYSKPRKLPGIPVRLCPSMFCFFCQATNTFCRSTSTTSWCDNRPDQNRHGVMVFSWLRIITLNHIVMYVCVYIYIHIFMCIYIYYVYYVMYIHILYILYICLHVYWIRQ